MDLPDIIEAKYIVNAGIIFAGAYLFMKWNISNMWAIAGLGIAIIYFNNSFMDKKMVIERKPQEWQQQQPAMQNPFNQQSFLDPSTGEFIQSENTTLQFKQYPKAGDFGFKGG